MVTLKKYYYVVKIKNIERDWKMENIFDNLKELKTDMEDKGWSIESFLFHYKEVQYVVLVKLYDEQKEKKPQYALVKMEFVDENNNSITIPTNSRGFMNEFVSIATIRNFFGVEYQENIGNFMQQFYAYLASYIPTEVSNGKSDREKECMVSSLSRSDGEDENKIYCYDIKRNPIVNNKQYVRSIYNDNKTRLLRPTLYEEYKDDNNAADLFVYANDTLWQKFAFEQDERGNHRIVTVRTQGTSDDNNHERLTVPSVYLKISSDTHTIASYYSLDQKEWQMVRLYKNYYPGKIWVGIASQCPQKGECTSLFEEVSLQQTAVSDFRMGE